MAFQFIFLDEFNLPVDWRVQIMQSNFSVRYFGRFSSEKRAREWIAAHSRIGQVEMMSSTAAHWGLLPLIVVIN
jgi:hypothetical protein